MNWRKAVILCALLSMAWCAGAARVFYVSPEGDESNSGLDWSSSLASISNGIARATMAGDTVFVSNGTYQIYATLEVTNGIIVKSLGGAAETIIDAGNSNGVGCVRILHPDAVLEGFTLTRGYIYNIAGQSGGIYMTNGTVRWCRIIDNCSYNSGIQLGGGAVNMSGGLMHHCIIQDTPVSIYHGTVYLSGNAILRNCLVTDNAYRRGGGIYMLGSSRVENCTVVRNTGTENSGGIYRGGGTVVNSIVYFNIYPNPNNINWNAAGGFEYSCSDPVPPGSNNIGDDPLLVDIDKRDYHLLPGSPAIGAGTTNLAWLADNPGEVDLDGNPRVVDGKIDMGAYQYTPGALQCGFRADVVDGFAPLLVQFTSMTGGTNTVGLTYYWDFTGDGVYAAGAAHPQYSYAVGTYSVSLVVSNAAGEAAAYTMPAYVQAAPSVCFVSPEGNAVFPYDTWAKAAKNLQPALDAAVDGTLIRVTNGVYSHSATYSITKGVTVRSENGAGETTLLLTGVDGRRSLYLSHPDVVVDGFTMMCTAKSTMGGGAQIFNFGTLRNSRIYGAKHNNEQGAGLKMNAGTVRNCLIAGCQDRHIGGFAMTGGLMENCVIVSNRNTLTTSDVGVGGGTVSGAATIMRNCLVYDNFSIGQTGGLKVSGGLVESCTIAGNTVTNVNAAAAGGLRLGGGTVRNTIISENFNLAEGACTNWYRSGGAINHSCTVPSAQGLGTGNITADPRFRDSANHDYRIGTFSPCFNAGDTQIWMAGAADLAGAPRLVGRAVDMGAFECQALPGVVLMIR